MAKDTREPKNGRGTKLKMRSLSSLSRARKPDNHAGESSKPDSAQAENLEDQRNDSHQQPARHSVGSFQRTLVARISPWYSFAALIGAALTPFVSLAILLGVRGNPVWPDSGITKVVSPASLLSALLSLNSFLITFAWSQGAATTWWSQSSRSDITYKELHTLWAVGTSWTEVLSHLKRPVFLSFVTLAVALNFITGFALQGALSTPSKTLSKHVSIKVPMAPVLDQGFSAQINNDGIIDQGSYYWQYVWQQVQNVVASPTSQYAYFGSLDENGNEIDLGYEEDAIYTSNINGAGFDYDCQPYNLTYDLTPTASRPQTKGTIFRSNFYWNLTRPNEMIFDIYWKIDGNCEGNYTGRHCVLRAATVQYPVTIQMAVPGIFCQGPFFSLQTGTTRHDDVTQSILKPYPAEGQNIDDFQNTTYGGIAESLASFFGASIDIMDSFTDLGDSYLNATGSLTDSMIYDYSDTQIYYCQISFESALQNLKYLDLLNKPNPSEAIEVGDSAWVDGSVDLAEVILTTVRESMFLSSVYTGSQGVSTNWNSHTDNWLPFSISHYVPTVPAVRQKLATVYDFRWPLWGVSAAVTWIVVTLVFASFGRWSNALKSTKSLSPLETAQVFDAPAFRHVPPDQDVEAMLEVVGSLPLQRPGSTSRPVS